MTQREFHMQRELWLMNCGGESSCGLVGAASHGDALQRSRSREFP
jgi:hypothetical protein